MPKYPLVNVIWIDSVFDSGVWVKGQDARDFAGAEITNCASIGYLVGDGATYHL